MKKVFLSILFIIPVLTGWNDVHAADVKRYTFCNNSGVPAKGLGGFQVKGVYHDFTATVVSAPSGCSNMHLSKIDVANGYGLITVTYSSNCIGSGDCITIEVTTTQGPIELLGGIVGHWINSPAQVPPIEINSSDVNAPPTIKGKCVKIIPPLGPCMDTIYYLTGCDTCMARSHNPNYNWWYGPDGICVVSSCPAVKPTSYGAPAKGMPPADGVAPPFYQDPVCGAYSNQPGSGWCEQKLSGFSSSYPPPPSVPGASTTHNYNAAYSASYSSGGPATPVTAPAALTLKVTYDSTYMSADYYHTELLQMNISGGTMPPGYMIRESPTRVSTGQTAITSYGNRFYYDSFLEVYTELSVNGGLTWFPSTTGHAIYSLQPEAPAAPSIVSVPALSEWGLIALGSLVVLFGAVFVRKIV